MIIINVIIGIIVGLVLTFCLTQHKLKHILTGGIAGLLGAWIGNNILESSTIITNVLTAAIGAMCLSLLLLYIQKLFLNFAE